MVRYEDLSLDPVNKTRQIFDFLGFNFSQQVSEFLESHTKTEKQNTYTVRDTKTVPFKWREKFNKTEVLQIQVGIQFSFDIFIVIFENTSKG